MIVHCDRRVTTVTVNCRLHLAVTVITRPSAFLHPSLCHLHTSPTLSVMASCGTSEHLSSTRRRYIQSPGH